MIRRNLISTLKERVSKMSVRRKTYIKKSSGNAIFSSKMFLSSTRQEKIRAAFNDAENLELVRQLDEYIGDEYIALMKPPKQTEKDVPEKTDAENNPSGEGKDEFTEKPTGNSRGGSPIKPAGKSLREEYTDLSEDMESDNTDIPTGGAEKTETTETTETQETVENTTKVSAASNILIGHDYDTAVNEIKGMLNANSTTTGVARVQRKDDEVWIYYKDSVNLNNLMDTVIEILDASGYTWMIFNRLARTDNAIVYALLGDDTLKNLPSPPVTHKV